MPLTAAEVRGTTFGTTRMRAGYDMDEVDAFLDIIEADVAQYVDELHRLRDSESLLKAQVDQLRSRLSAAEERAPRHVEATPEPAKPADVTELIAGVPEAETVVAIAERTADEMIRFAESRAESIKASVRTMLNEQLSRLDRP